jgi:sorting nexin-29
MNQIFSVRTILQKCYEFSVDLHILFIDFKQAYDGIHRNKLYKILNERGIPGKLIRLVSMSLTNIKGRVVTYGEVPENFKTERDLNQGYVLPTMLFNFVLEKVITNITTDADGMIQYLAHADDGVIISRTEMDLRSAVSQPYAKAKENGVITNESKTKYMIISRNKDGEVNKT